MEEKKRDETQRGYALIRILGLGVLALIMLVSAAGAAPYAYITNNYDSTISVIDTATNTVTASIELESFPFGVAVNPEGTKVYVTCMEDTVSVIDTDTNSVIATVNVGSYPVGVSVAPAGTNVYATNYGSGTISVIDSDTNAVTATVTVGTGPKGIAVSPDGTKVYVTNLNSNDVSVIDTATNTVTATIPAGLGPNGIAVNPNGLKVYVANYYDNTISVIDTATNNVTSIMAVGNYPEEVAVSPDGTKIYVTNGGNDTVSMIDTSTNTITATVNVGTHPLGIAFTPDGTEIYVTNFFSGTVSIIDAVTNTVTATVDAGDGPAAFGQFIGPAPKPEPPAPYEINTTQVTTSGSASDPHIYGERIVYEDRRNGKSDVYMYDLSIKQETQISTSGAAKYPAICSDRIVYADSRNEKSDIYLYDISTSQETQISTKGTAYSASELSGPDICNDKIVWQEQTPGGTYGLFVYDLSTQQETQIAEESIDDILWSGFYGFAIHGDKIVYNYFTSDETSLTRVYDLSTQQTTEIGGLTSASPDIYGDRAVCEEVSWEGDPEDSYSSRNIYVYDLSTQQGIQVSASGKAHKPAIYSDRIVWEDDLNGQNIYMYDLSKSREVQVTDGGSAYSPDLYGDRIVWVEGDNIYMSTVSEKEVPHEIQINRITTSGSANFPDIYGNNIVWQDSDYGYTDLSVYNLLTQTETQITTNLLTVPREPKIYEDRIVWIDSKNGSYDEYGNYDTYDIYLYNISTSEKTQITTSGSASWPTAPAIYGNRIVWHEYRNGTGAVYMYDLSTQEETQITNNGEPKRPAVYDDKIVWEQVNSSTDGGDFCIHRDDVYVYNISTNNTAKIITNKANYYRVSVSGDKIAWQSWINGDSDIHVYDLSTGKDTQITSNGRAYWPDIYGDRIVWYDHRNDNADIYLYNTSTSEETQVTADNSDQRYPAIYGDRIVWEDQNDIYIGTVSGKEPEPVLPVANFSSNVTDGYAPLAVQFTDRSENATGWNWDFGDGTTSTEQNPLHIFSTAGTYNVNLIVSNENSTDSKSAAITVLEPVIPVASFSASPTAGKAPLTVTFTDQSTGSPASWYWKFGDKVTSTDQNPVHTYKKAGKYTVSLTVKNAVGKDTKKICKYIIVKKK